MDVRNGILLDPGMHRYFDKFYFTIIRTGIENDSVFKIKIGEHLYPSGDAEFSKLDGKTLFFGDKSYLWPHQMFLKFHNRRFNHKQEEAKMKAAAEPKEFNRQDSDATMVPNLHALDDDLKVKWIREHDNEPYELLEVNDIQF